MAIGDIVSGIFGGSAGKKEMKAATEASRQALAELRRLQVPEVEIQKIALTNPELAGLLEAETLAGSSLEDVYVDPRLKNAQMKALEELSGLSSQGLGAEDVAAFNNLKRQAAAQSQAENAQVLQNAAARGTLDSGSSLLSQLLSGQQATNRLQQSGEQLAAQAAQARREALNNYSDLSNNLVNQDFSQKSQVANAKDTINQFNSQTKNAANQYNLTNRQNLANQKSSNANQQEIYNKQLIQQKFQNDLSKATGVAGQQNNLAGIYASQGQAAAQGQAQMMGSLLGLAGTVGGAAVGGPAGAAVGGKVASGLAPDRAGGTTQYSRDYLTSK